jgi:hypothetical protein
MRSYGLRLITVLSMFGLLGLSTVVSPSVGTAAVKSKTVKASPALITACNQLLAYVAGEPLATTSARLSSAGTQFLAAAAKDRALRASFIAMTDTDLALASRNLEAAKVAIAPALAACVAKAKIDPQPAWSIARLPDGAAVAIAAAPAVPTAPATTVPGIDARNKASNTNLASQNNGLPFGFSLPKQAATIKLTDLSPDTKSYQIVGDDQLGPMTNYLEGQCGIVGWPKIAREEPSRKKFSTFTGWTSFLVCRAPDMVGGTTWVVTFEVLAVEGTKALIIFTTMTRFTP